MKFVLGVKVDITGSIKLATTFAPKTPFNTRAGTVELAIELLKLDLRLALKDNLDDLFSKHSSHFVADNRVSKLRIRIPEDQNNVYMVIAIDVGI